MGQNWRHLGINLLIINNRLTAEQVELRSDNKVRIGWDLPRIFEKIRVDSDLPIKIDKADLLQKVRGRFTILNGFLNIDRALDEHQRARPQRDWQRALHKQ